MLRGLFVTGTDTGVGKTVASAALLHRYRPARLRYWKPIQTGIEQDNDSAEVRRLAACRDEEILDEGIRLPNPVSPHLAAERAGIAITLDRLRALLPEDDGIRWIVEGAGGVLVPINGRDLMVDWMRALGLPVLVAARSGLGTINHTLLTVEALDSRGLWVAGVMMIGERNESNRAAIERYGGVPVVGEMPVFPVLDQATLARWSMAELDPQNRLLECFQ
jgi:dethiobiotin synthetase